MIIAIIMASAFYSSRLYESLSVIVFSLKNKYVSLISSTDVLYNRSLLVNSFDIFIYIPRYIILIGFS
jgi:hypothetical protein